MIARLLRRPHPEFDVATTFLRSTYMRAMFHQGYWLVASLTFVVNAHLSAFPLRIGASPTERASSVGARTCSTGARGARSQLPRNAGHRPVRQEGRRLLDELPDTSRRS